MEAQTETQLWQRIINIIDKVVPILTFVLGIVLAPYVSNIFEKRKRKTAIKSDLGKQIYLLFQLRALQVEYINHERIYKVILKIHNDNYLTEHKPDKKKETKEAYEYYTKGRAENRQRSLDTFKSIIDLESNIVAHVLELSRILRLSEHNKLELIIDEILNEYNDPEKLNITKDLTIENVAEINGEIGQRITEKSIEINGISDRYIKRVSSVF
jgi:hypothetical protein